MPACREVTRLVASDELQDAGWRRRLVVRLHLLMCRHCRRYANQLRNLGTVARSIWNAEQADEESKTLERLEEVILASSSDRQVSADGARRDDPDASPDRGYS